MKKAILYISRGTEVPKFVKEIYPLIQGEESQLYLLYVLEEKSTEFGFVRPENMVYISSSAPSYAAKN